jgi:hypothetical protein
MAIALQKRTFTKQQALWGLSLFPELGFLRELGKVLFYVASHSGKANGFSITALVGFVFPPVLSG